MSAEDLVSAPAFRVSDLIRRGAEPPPVAFLARSPSYPWLIVGICCVSGFMGQLDASIVQLALPTLGRVFDSSLEGVSWVALGYLLGFASCLPIFGQLCQIVGRKLMYLLGFAVFTAASALCAFAPDLLTLIAFRILQGVGGAMLGANSLAVIAKATDQSRRARALGVFAAALAIGISAGPIVGGVLLGTLGWRWVFWINVPFGLIAIVAGGMILPLTEQEGESQTFDWRGALLLTPALTLAVFALNQAAALGLASPLLLGCVGGAIALLVLFGWQETKARSPLVDLALLKEPAFLAGSLGCALSYAMLYGMFFLASFALVRGYEDSPVVAGLKLAVVPISIGIVAPVAGALADWMGTRLLSVAGMAISSRRCFALIGGRDGAHAQSLGRLVRSRRFRNWPRAVHRAQQPRDHQRGPGQPFGRRRGDGQPHAGSRHGRGGCERVRHAVLAAAGRAGIDRAAGSPPSRPIISSRPSRAASSCWRSSR